MSGFLLDLSVISYILESQARYMFDWVNMLLRLDSET